MKKIIAAIAALICGSAIAGGQFDGVYQSVNNPEQFYSIHQNGTTLLLTNYGTMPTDGGIYFRYGTEQFRPPKIYTWDVQTGQLDGNRAVMTGGILQNACTLTYQLELSAERITATYLRAEQRLGGVSCATLLPVGTVESARRMF